MSFIRLSLFADFSGYFLKADYHIENKEMIISPAQEEY